MILEYFKTISEYISSSFQPNYFVFQIQHSYLFIFHFIISKLFTDLDVFEPNPLLRENYEIGEEELRYFAKEALSKIKTYNDS